MPDTRPACRLDTPSTPDDREIRDNGFIFDVPEVFADTVDRWITRGRPASDGVLYPYDVFAHLDT